MYCGAAVVLAKARIHLQRFSACTALALTLCASASAAHFAFGAFGDTPYNRDEEPQLVSMIAEMNRQPLAFTIHVGDFKDARTECSDALFAQRRDAFALSHHAFFYTPGDNEWTDCRRAWYARRDPLERLAKLRQMFFARDASLGQQPLAAERQSARGFPENMRWQIEDVVLATLNIPGPNNNRTSLPDEAKRRTPAVLEWMRETFRIARSRKLPGLVLATQANLFTGSRGYADIVAALTEEAQRYDGEILVVHGDTHWFRFDRPLAQAPNVSRLEVYGSPFVNWVCVQVATENGRVTFSVTPGSEISARGKP